MSTYRQLDLSPYLSSISEHGAVYDLYAVVNHYGGILYGHYTSFARCPAATSDKNQKDVVGNLNYAPIYKRRLSAFLLFVRIAFLLSFTFRMALHGRPSSARHLPGHCRHVGCLPVALPKTSRATWSVCPFLSTAQLQRSRRDWLRPKKGEKEKQKKLKSGVIWCYWYGDDTCATISLSEIRFAGPKWWPT